MADDTEVSRVRRTTEHIKTQHKKWTAAGTAVILLTAAVLLPAGLGGAAGRDRDGMGRGGSEAGVEKDKAGEAAAQAYLAFLSGDFTHYNEEDKRPREQKEAEGVFMETCQAETLAAIYDSTGREWTYVLKDLDGDGTEELFVRLGDKAATAVFHYEDGYITCWNMDTMELNCYDQPMENGLVLETYTMGRPDGDWEFYTTRRYTGCARYERKERYTVLNVDEYGLDLFREEYAELFPEINQAGTYYFRTDLKDSAGGQPVLLTEEEWQEAEREILVRVIAEEEWASAAGG